MTLSAGVAAIDPRGGNPGTLGALLEAADAALYQAKAAGRNRVAASA